MGFWDDLAKPFVAVYDSAIKPVGNWIGGAGETVYNGAIKPVGNFIGNTAEKVVNVAEKAADKALNTFDFLQSPILWIGVGIVAIVVLPPLLNNMGKA